MKIIGENLNVIKTEIGKAFKDRNPEPIQKMAWRKKRQKALTGSTSTWDPHAKAAPS
jgi:hypothetical protein